MRRSLRPYRRRYDPPGPAGLGRREETRRRAGRLLLKEEPPTVLVVMTAVSRGQASLIDRAAPRYQAVTSVIVHALTAGFVTMTAWCVAGGFAITAIALLTGRAAGGTAGTQTRSA